MLVIQYNVDKGSTLRETYGHFLQLFLCRWGFLSRLGRFFLNRRRVDFQAKLWRLNKESQMNICSLGLPHQKIDFSVNDKMLPVLVVNLGQES